MASFSTPPRKVGRTLVFMAETRAFQIGSRVMESVTTSDSFSPFLQATSGRMILSGFLREGPTLEKWRANIYFVDSRTMILLKRYRLVF
jgi:hypothetical protein